LLKHAEITGYPNPGYNTTRLTGWPFFSLSSIDADLGSMTEHVVLYDVNFHDNGVWPPTYETGRHAINSSGNARYVWVLGSVFVRNPEDGIQLMTQGGRNTASYWYMGGNSFSQLGENGIDLKLSSDIIISQNTFFDIDQTDWLGGHGSDGAAIVINDEGPPDRAWVLYNHFYDCGRGVRSQSPGSHYIIGNLIHDANINNNGLGDAIWSAASEMNVVDNTIYNVYEGIVLMHGQSSSTVHGNIVSELLDNSNYCINLNQNYFDGQATNNIYYDSDGSCHASRVYGVDGNLLNTNPLIVNPAGGNFSLQAGSPAINESLESPVYDLYFATYGLDIKKDNPGLFRPQGSAWDIGAFEYDEGTLPDTTPPSAPTGLSVL
jgi:hypothetical protein